MVNTLSPFKANLFKSEFKIHITGSFLWMYKSWNLMMDINIFWNCQKQQLDDSLKLLDIQDKNTNFNMKIENNNYLFYVKIIKK